MKTLFLIVNPSDRPSIDVDVLWDQLKDALLSAFSECVCDRIPFPTEAALGQALSQGHWNVLHILTHAQEPEAGGYGTVALLSTDGGSRYLPPKHFASLLAGVSSLKLIVLQAMGGPVQSFANMAQSLAAQGLPGVICAPSLRGRSTQLFIAKLYGGLASGSSLAELEKAFSALGANSGDGVLSQVRAYGQNMDSSIFPASHHAPDRQIEKRDEVKLAPETPKAPETEREAEAWRRELKRKRESGVFDVFLSHNSDDKPWVKQLGIQLMQVGILPWLDVWELQPGQLWQPALYEQLHNIRSAAVCVGSAGIHKWQEREINTLFVEFVDRNAPVIPVLLPNAPADPKMPGFLRTLNWVDFRTNDPPPLERLVWGITGRRPEH